MLFLAGALILRRNVYDTVGIDIEGDFDLRNSAGSGGNAVEHKASERRVARCHFTFALQYVNFNRGLTVGCGRVDLTLLDRDGRVAFDDLVEYAAQRFDTERKRRNVEKNDALDILVDNTALNRCTDGNAFIGVDALEGFFADKVLNSFLNGGNTRRTADEKDFRNIRGLETGVGKRLLGRAHRLLYKIGGQFVELCTGKGHIEMLRTGRVRRDKRKIDLCLFCGFLQSLERHFVVAQIDAVFGLEGVRHVIHDLFVEVVAAETVVARRRQNFDNAVADFEDRDIERTAAEVEDHDLLFLFLIHTVSKSGSRRLVDDTFYVKTCDLARVLGRLTLCVGEVSGDGDDRFGHGCAEVSFRVALELLQNHRGNFLRRILFAVDIDLAVGTHITLDGNNGAVGVGDRLTFCDLTDHTLARLGESDDRRSRARTLRIRNDNRFAAFINGNARVRSTKVYTNDFSHNKYLRYLYQKFFLILYINAVARADSVFNLPLLPWRSGSLFLRACSPFGIPP